MHCAIWVRRWCSKGAARRGGALSGKCGAAGASGIERELWEWLSVAYAEAGNARGAVEAARTATANSTDPAVYMLAGQALTLVGMPNDAAQAV